MNRLLYFAACAVVLVGCKDQDIRVGIGEVRSRLERRLDASERLGSWEFKYTHSGKWAISCRPPGIMSEFGVNYWATLSRVPSSDSSGCKVFTGSRLGDEVTVHVYRTGAAFVFFERDGDEIMHALATVYTARRESNSGVDRLHDDEIQQLKFFRAVFANN